MFCAYNVTLSPVLCNHCGGGKAISITYSECVYVVLVIQHAMRLRRFVLCGLPCCTLSFHIT